jgi:hypothetical protein
MELGFGCANSHSLHLGNLVMLVALNVMKHEYLSRSFWEPLDRGFEIDTKTWYLRPRLNALERVFRIGKPAAGGGERLTLCKNHIDRHSVQPRAERRLPAKRRELLPRSNEDVLCNFVRFVRAEHPSSQTVHSIHVRSVEALECLGVSARS